MRQPKSSEPDRRKFLSIMPACALTCMGLSSVLAHERSKHTNSGSGLQEDVHPFAAEYPRKFSWQEFYLLRYGILIRYGQWMIKEKGKDEALEELKKFASQGALANGKRKASLSTSKSLHEFTEQFRDASKWKNKIMMEIVEDTEKAFELKVTECIYANTFRSVNAADVGTALLCNADYYGAEGFNPKIKLVRSKTIMNGDPICNHRYIWQA